MSCALCTISGYHNTSCNATLPYVVHSINFNAISNSCWKTNVMTCDALVFSAADNKTLHVASLMGLNRHDAIVTGFVPLLLNECGTSVYHFTLDCVKSDLILEKATFFINCKHDCDENIHITDNTFLGKNNIVVAYLDTLTNKAKRKLSDAQLFVRSYTW